MRILYVEDDVSKVTDVRNLLDDVIPINNLVIKNSLTSGIIELRKNKFDLILLDMSLPLYDFKESDNDGDFETFAGIDILEEMKRIKLSTNVIIITAFDVLGENKLNLDQLNKEMLQDYGSIYKGIIHYKTTTLEWSNSFKKLIEKNYKI